MPPRDNEQELESSLEELRRKLYANEAPSVPVTVAPTHIDTAPAATPAAWAPPPPPPPPKKKVAWSFLFLVSAAIIFVIALMVAGYFLIFGARAISTDRVEITVEPTPSLKSGEVATLLVTVKNNNPTAINHTNLSAIFPDSARDPDNQLSTYPRFDDTLGDIPAGETRTKSIRVALSGAEGQTFQIPLKLEYRTEGSNAVFVKDASHDVTISSSPLSVKVTLPPDVAVGQQLTIQVTVHSDAKVPVENVAILADGFPSGFVPANAAQMIFDVGTLNPGGDQTVTLTGTLVGDDVDARVFRFKAGTKGQNGTLALVYASGQGQVSIRKPFLNTTLAINHDTSMTPVMVAGQQTSGVLTWANTLASTLTDAQITVKLSGEALDATSVVAGGGFYRSADTTIVYARDTNPTLAKVAPGDSGNGTFTFSTKSAAAMKSIRNPAITVAVTVSGRVADGTNAPKMVTATMTRTIQVATDLALRAQSVRTTGPFKNTGPWPPVADSESTYTILLSFTNTVNAVAGSSVTATLPSYVRFTGATSPNDGSITYDPVTRVVTWNAGEIAAGTTSTSPKQAAFQVALLPSITQRGTSPVLVSQVSYAGTDRFTKRAIQGTAYDVTTQTTSDPAYKTGFGEVAR